MADEEKYAGRLQTERLYNTIAADNLALRTIMQHFFKNIFDAISNGEDACADLYKSSIERINTRQVDTDDPRAAAKMTQSAMLQVDAFFLPLLDYLSRDKSTVPPEGKQH
jgi:hypothetical protein